MAICCNSDTASAAGDCSRAAVFWDKQVLLADEAFIVLQTHWEARQPLYVFDSTTGEILYANERVNNVWKADEGRPWLFNIEKREAHSLTQEVQHDLILKWHDDDTILAEVYAGDYCSYCGDNAFVARWLIRVDS